MSVVNVMKIVGCAVVGGVIGAGVGYGGFKLYMKLSGKDAAKKALLRAQIQDVINDIEFFVGSHTLISHLEIKTMIKEIQTFLLNPDLTEAQLTYHLGVVRGVFSDILFATVR